MEKIVYTTIGIYKINHEDIFYGIIKKINKLDTVHIEALENLGIIEFVG